MEEKLCRMAGKAERSRLCLARKSIDDRAVCIICILQPFRSCSGVLILVAAGAATYFVFLNLSVEYEYLFADGGFSVDRILGKARRKKSL